MKEICIQNLSFTIGAKDILKNISVKINAGKFIGLLGPNGCGKSTLLKHLYRVHQIQSGQIYFDQKSIHDISLREAAQKIGVMGQFNTVDFDFTVLEITLMGRSPYKKSFEDDTVHDYELAEEALRKTGMWEQKNRLFNSLSGGEQQRVMLARTLVQEPEYLILDEPTNHLDIKYQLHLLQVVKDLHIGVIAALHDMNLAAMYCDELIIMKRGQVMVQGSPRDVMTSAMIESIYDVQSNVSYDQRGVPLINYRVNDDINKCYLNNELKD